MKAIAALVLSACAGSAIAGPVTFEKHGNYDVTGGDGTAFFNVFPSLLSLTAPSWVSGHLASDDAELIDVESVTLRHVGGPEVITWTLDQPGSGLWSLPTLQLGAGDWQLEVSGVTFLDKGLEGYAGSLTVPEPLSLGLVALGLGLVGVTRRRA